MHHGPVSVLFVQVGNLSLGVGDEKPLGNNIVVGRFCRIQYKTPTVFARLHRQRAVRFGINYIQPGYLIVVYVFTRDL
ncbi:hypothetical protein [Spirosoma sp. KNUC1025]|uniref:hypothetical protein n=1 Tax=Spirosoma sp. KNUC1025 TaxID=2894082 RepID=UPI001E4371F0|nr:hypothetical protein [Spirosoma sp. KNUC1025]UFH57767.1 hypothetical protein LN737_32615 [Spirosoma sp. KNUC1025]